MYSLNIKCFIDLKREILTYLAGIRQRNGIAENYFRIRRESSLIGPLMHLKRLTPPLSQGEDDLD